MHKLFVSGTASLRAVSFVFIILFGALNVWAFTVDGINYRDCSQPTSGLHNRVEVIGGTPKDGMLTIPGVVESPDGKTFTVSRIGMFAFQNKSDIKNVALPAGIDILQGAFMGCSALEEIDMSDIGNIYLEAFRGCKSLRRVVLPERLSFLPDDLFCGCYNLRDIDLSAVTEINDGALYDCNLTGCIPPRELTYIGKEALALTYGIKSVVFTGESRHFNAEAFVNSAIESVIFRAPGDMHIPGQAFSGCKYLHTVAAEDGCRIKSIGYYAFNNCQSLLPFDLTGVTEISEGAFSGCRKWDRLDLPRSLQSVGRQAFYGTSIKHVEFPYWIDESKIGDNAFASSQLVSVIWPETWTDISRHLSMFSSSSGTLEEVVLPGDCGSIPDEAFYNCYKLKRVSGGQSLMTIGNRAFEYCSSLETFDHDSDIEEIGVRAFYQCESLKTFKAGISLKKILKGAFQGCKMLESIDTHGMGTVVFVGEQAFRGSGLIDCGFLAYHDEPVDIEWEAFRDCRRLKGINLDLGFGEDDPDYENNYVCLPSALRKIGTDAFLNCTSIKGLWIEEPDQGICLEVTANPKNGSVRSPFTGCQVERLVILRDIIPDDAAMAMLLPPLDHVNFLRFGIAYGHKAMDVRGLPANNDGAVNLPELRQLEIGNRVDPIPSFAASPLLRSVMLRGNYEIPPRARGFHPDTYTYGHLDVENEDAYREADPWCNFFNMQSAIDDVAQETESDRPATEYYNLYGQKIAMPQSGALTIIRRDGRAAKRIVF